MTRNVVDRFAYSVLLNLGPDPAVVLARPLEVRQQVPRRTHCARREASVAAASSSKQSVWGIAIRILNTNECTAVVRQHGDGGSGQQ